MRQRIHRYAETFQRSHTQKMHVSRLGKDHFVIGDESFRLENAKTDVPIHGPAISHSEQPPAARLDTGAGKNIHRQPTQLGTGIDQYAPGHRANLFSLRINRDQIDVISTHNTMMMQLKTGRKSRLCFLQFASFLYTGPVF
jgi:hypothetical protein